MVTVNGKTAFDAIGVPADDTVEAAGRFVGLQIGEAQHDIPDLAATIRSVQLCNDTAVVENSCTHSVVVAERIDVNGPAVGGDTIITNPDTRRGLSCCTYRHRKHTRHCHSHSGLSGPSGQLRRPR